MNLKFGSSESRTSNCMIVTAETLTFAKLIAWNSKCLGATFFLLQRCRAPRVEIRSTLLELVEFLNKFFSSKSFSGTSWQNQSTREQHQLQGRMEIIWSHPMNGAKAARVTAGWIEAASAIVRMFTKEAERERMKESDPNRTVAV